MFKLSVQFVCVLFGYRPTETRDKFYVVIYLVCDNFYNPQLAHLLDIILMLIIIIIIGQVHKQTSKAKKV